MSSVRDVATLVPPAPERVCREVRSVLGETGRMEIAAVAAVPALHGYGPLAAALFGDAGSFTAEEFRLRYERAAAVVGEAVDTNADGKWQPDELARARSQVPAELVPVLCFMRERGVAVQLDPDVRACEGVYEAIGRLLIWEKGRAALPQYTCDEELKLRITLEPQSNTRIRAWVNDHAMIFAPREQEFYFRATGSVRGRAVTFFLNVHTRPITFQVSKLSVGIGQEADSGVYFPGKPPARQRDGSYSKSGFPSCDWVKLIKTTAR